MSRILLNKWSAIESFIKLARMYDKIRGREIKEAVTSALLKSYIKLYIQSDKELSKKLAIELWGDKDDNTKTPKRLLHATLMYELANAIAFNEPYRTSSATLEAIELYIGKLEGEVTELVKSDDYNYILKLANTKWFVYYFDFFDQKVDIKHSKKITGVVKGILEIKDFGICILKGFSAKANVPREFSGNVEYENKRFLLFRFKTKYQNQGDLVIRMYIGTEDKFSLALGLLHTYREQIYTKTIMFEEVPSDFVEDKFSSTFYPYVPNKKPVEIPTFVWKYFEGHSRNYISVPMKVVSESTLVSWFADQDAIRKSNEEDMGEQMKNRDGKKKRESK